MLITRRALPRRAILKGMGTTLALPLLDAMVPAATTTAQTAAAPVRRLGFVYVPNGANMAHWTPAEAGKTFDLSPILQPLAPLKDRVVVVSGLGNSPADAWGDGGGDHSRGPAAWLSAVHPKRTEGADIHAGTTIDQLVAQRMGGHTQLASLELATEATGLVGDCGGAGYSCVYIDTLCWRTPTSPLPMETNPRVVFELMFGDGATREQRAIRLRENRSILDAVTAELGRLRTRLGTPDRTRINEYLDAVREVERRIQHAEAQERKSELALPDRPVGVPDDFEEHVAVMFELQALAFQADVTRVTTFMLSRELSQRAYTKLGISDPHHAISHHQDDPDKLAKIAKINTYHVSLFASYLERLRTTPDGDGSLLDHTLILYGGGMADGNLHSHSPLPVVLAGGAAGRLAGGRHLSQPLDTPFANLLLSIGQLMDLPIDRFGDSRGALSLT
ncbi:MAG: DUF1552 domain-containing protein [Acidimicrobiia bacterium]|nr:DUF1552 domain-containing protein [Acidimicrobiia bacterium]